MEIDVDKAFQGERKANRVKVLKWTLAGCSRSIRRAGRLKQRKGAAKRGLR